ncbi:hypothetical protein ACQKP5_14055 [Pseudomonas vancouverensis]|uniref:hypothetical protein n=1 Tax=Pseudomonas vancouverensis TaxID=95300 RepID=UPI003D019984
MIKTAFDTWLVNGNITIFCGPHTDSFKKDILASSLFGELVASQKSSSRVASWSTYKETVQKIGWTTNSQSSRRFEFKKLSLLNIARQSTSNYLSQDEQQAVTKAMSQLAELQPDSTAITTIVKKLESNAIEGKDNTNAVISTAALMTFVRSNKTVITQQVTFATDHEPGVGLLDQPVLSAIEDRQTNCWQLRSLLDDRHYSQVREDILKKLGHNIETKLLHIHAPDT